MSAENCSICGEVILTECDPVGYWNNWDGSNIYCVQCFLKKFGSGEVLKIQRVEVERKIKAIEFIFIIITSIILATSIYLSI